MPQARLGAVVEPYYPKSGWRGRPPIGLDRMLRMYFVQQWYALADEAVEDTLLDSQGLRQFCGFDLAVEQVPDAPLPPTSIALNCGLVVIHPIAN